MDLITEYTCYVQISVVEISKEFREENMSLLQWSFANKRFNTVHEYRIHQYLTIKGSRYF